MVVLLMTFPRRVDLASLLTSLAAKLTWHLGVICWARGRCTGRITLEGLKANCPSVVAVCVVQTQALSVDKCLRAGGCCFDCLL